MLGRFLLESPHFCACRLRYIKKKNNLKLLQYTRSEILEASKIGIEFEFLTEMGTVHAARELADLLGVKIVIPVNVDNFLKPEKTVHSSYIPTESRFKLEKDNSGGADMCELVTGPLPYPLARFVIEKTLNWIDENGSTTDRAAFQINISFDKEKINTHRDIEKLNVLKMCLNYNEDYVYERFPERENNEYAKSIKNVITNNIFYHGNNITSISKKQFIVPKSKYFGVNFTKIKKNYLEFRQMGGEDYHKKKKEIFEILDFNILSVYDIIEDHVLSQKDLMKLNSILEENHQLLSAYKDPLMFRKMFPKIAVTSDMDWNVESLKTRWHMFRDKIRELILTGGLLEGGFNYDSDFSTFQLRDSVLDGVDLNEYEFINCTLRGEFTNCQFYNCKIEGSIINEGVLHQFNELSKTKINEVTVFTNNGLTNCYIDNKDKLFNGSIEGGVFRSGKKGKAAYISESTKLVDVK